MNLPNKLTVFRIVLVPVMVCFLLCECIPYRYLIASVIFAVASITDFFDGKIARTGNPEEIMTDIRKSGFGEA